MKLAEKVYFEHLIQECVYEYLNTFNICVWLIAKLCIKHTQMTQIMSTSTAHDLLNSS